MEMKRYMGAKSGQAAHVIDTIKLIISRRASEKVY